MRSHCGWIESPFLLVTCPSMPIHSDSRTLRHTAPALMTWMGSVRPTCSSTPTPLYSCVTPTNDRGHAAHTKRLALALAGGQTCEEHQSGAQSRQQSDRRSARRKIATTSRDTPRTQHSEATTTSSRTHPPEPVSLVLDRPRGRQTLLVGIPSAKRPLRPRITAEVSNRHIYQPVDRTGAIRLYPATELDRRHAGKNCWRLWHGIGKSWRRAILLSRPREPGTSRAERFASCASVHDRWTKGTIRWRVASRGEEVQGSQHSPGRDGS